MAKAIADNSVEVRCVYDAESGTNKVHARTAVVNGTESRQKYMEIVLTTQQQTDLDALMADALAQAKSDESIA